MAGSYIVAGARTPIAKLGGGFATLSATDLGGIAIKAALERAGVAPDQADYVIMGHVIQAGTGQITARRAAVNAGVPLDVPAITINKVCISGLHAIYLADQMIASGDADIVIAGGMESMSNAPYLLPGARAGYRAGDKTVVDSLFHDALFCAFDSVAMGESTEKYSASANISREAQDLLSANSHQRAAAALAEGRFADEMVSVEVPQRRGDPIVVSADEGVRANTTAESLAKLKPAFASSGNITAGNASQISDGASAVVMMSKAMAEKLGVTPLGEVVSYGMMSGPDMSLLTKPSQAIFRALDKTDLSVSDIDLFELNEAFAAVGVASMQELGITDEIVNVNGGAVAQGHPVGASGNRIALTLLHEMKRRGVKHGAASLCGGGGQGDALIVRSV